MRGIETQVRKVRRRVFKEIADLAYHSENLIDDMEALPYKIVPGEDNEYWESVYRERAVVRERIRLAMGMSLRPEDAPVHVSQGVEESNIAEKYYEPPLLQVIPSACNACPENQYEVTNKCMGCLAHPCNEVCPRGAITMVHGKSYIDQEKCIKCGKVMRALNIQYEPHSTNIGICRACASGRRNPPAPTFDPDRLRKHLIEVQEQSEEPPQQFSLFNLETK